MTARKRTLSAYDGRRLLGRVEIMPRAKRTPKIRAMNAAGKLIGIFKNQRAALAAIDLVAGR